MTQKLPPQAEAWLWITELITSGLITLVLVSIILWAVAQIVGMPE